MNASNFAHAGLSLLFQSATTLIAYFCGFSIVDASCLGGSVAIGFYIGREVTQAERKAGGNLGGLALMFEDGRLTPSSIFSFL